MGECRQTAEKLTPYVDGVLSPSEHADVERHLGACPPCRRAAAQVSGGRTILRDRATPLRATPVPPGLRSRCEGLAQMHGRPAPWLRRLLPAFAITALVLATGLAVASMETRRSNVLLAQQLTLDHVKCTYLFESPDTPPMEARDAESRLAGFGWHIHVPPSSPRDGIALVDVRRCLYASGTIPHVIYRVNGQNVSLFMLQGVTRPSADLDTLGYESQIWSRGATTYVLVAPRTQHIAATAARYVMEQAF
jgi:anti-sigma factor RsiW